VNVYAFRTAIAPHLAAQEEGVRIDTDRIVSCFERLVPLADVILVEGAGGWLAPINETETLADVARRLALPVVLVVGMRLGCINHALLSAQSIAACGLPFAGWVANRIDPQMASFEGNLASLVARLPAPLLASIAYQSAPDPNSVAIRLP
jgi:dethiobiotin synthetase